MQLPRTIKIGPYTYSVSLEEQLRGDKNQELYGEINYSRQTIRPRSDLPDERTRATLLHEVIHGIDDFMLIGLSEKQVTRLGDALAVFLSDHAALFLVDHVTS